MSECAIVGKRIEYNVLCPGVARGRLVVPIPVSSRTGEFSESGVDVGQEVERFRARAEQVVQDLGRETERLRNEGFFDRAKVLETHAVLLQDLRFRHEVETLIRQETKAETALSSVLGRMMEQLEHSGDPVMSERAADMRDILSRLQRQSDGKKAAVLDALRDVEHPVLAVRELLPSLVLEARDIGVVAFIVEKGTSLSHAAILAKSFGIPVLRTGDLCSLREANGRDVLVDAVEGRLFVDPTPEQIEHAGRIEDIANQPQANAAPARLWINIVDPDQILSDRLDDIAGVGLYRTETLFMKAEHNLPSEQEQCDVYRQFLERCGDKPATLRTLDIGSDKQLSYSSLGPQKNPYLELRAHRIYRFHPEIFITQMRAVLRAAAGRANLRILYPMVETLDSLLFIQDLLRQAVQSLESEGQDYQRQFDQGIMVEVPSAAWEIEELLAHVDFASVGTNDLFQYFFAVDRNIAFTHANDQPEHPAGLRLLRMLLQAAERVGKPLSLCGELASNPQFVPLLVGLGFRDLSVDVHALARIKGVLASLDPDSCRLLARRCLKARTSEEVRDILQASCPTRTIIGRASRSGYVDPMCDMAVDPEHTKYVVRREGGDVYFCSARCRDEYLSAGVSGFRARQPFGS